MAEEKVKIAEIDIGVDKILSKAAKTKKEIAALQQSQKDLKKETNNLTSASQEQLEQYTLGEIELKKYKKEVRDSQKVLDAYIHIQNQDIRTKDQARDANRKLIAIANQLDATNVDQAATLEKVNAEIDRNTDFIKENASEYERTKINIGNYKEQVTEALHESGLFGDEIRQVTNITQNFAPVFNTLRADFRQGADDIKNAAKSTKGMSNSQKLLTVTTKSTNGALKLFRVALAATGIGLVVVALGSLVTYFASTQEGINKVNMVLTPLKEGFNAVKGSVQELGGALAKLLSGDFTGFINDIKRVGAEMKNNIKEAVERGKEMETIQQNLNKTEADYIKKQAELRKEFEQQKKLSDDTTKSTEVREKAAQRAIELQEEISKGTIERINQEAEILRMKQMSNDTSDEERADLARKLAEIDQALEEEAAKTTEAQNKLNAIRKEGADKRKQYAEEAFNLELKQNQLALERFELQQGYAKKTASEELKIAREVYEKQLAIEKKKLEAGKITQEELTNFILENKNDLARRQAEIAVQTAEKELEIFKDAHQSKIDSNQFLNEQLFNQEQDRLNKIAEAEREFQKKRLEEGVINQNEYNQAINEVNDENRKQQEDLRKEREAAKKEKEAFELEMQRELEMERFQNKFELERAREQQRYEAELAAAEKLGADTTAIEKKHAKNQEKIEEQKQLAKIQMYADSFGQIAKVLGEQTALGKGLALAQALINTYTGITAALSLPFPANIAAAATTGATGFKAVKNITSTKVPKAEKGISMDIIGPSHSQGGSTFYDGEGNPIVEAQGGEKMVILKREASRELDVLSKLNQKHGGVSLSKPVSYAANGGAIIKTPIINRSKNFKVDYDKIGESVGMYVSQNINAIQTVVPVDSITDVAARTARAEQRADL